MKIEDTNLDKLFSEIIKNMKDEMPAYEFNRLIVRKAYNVINPDDEYMFNKFKEIEIIKKLMIELDLIEEKPVKQFIHGVAHVTTDFMFSPISPNKYA